jgi:hypothetical protein
MIGVNTTVVPLVWTRHGPGGWMETIARFGGANEFVAPGGARNVSMFTTPPAVVLLVRAYPGSVGGPGGKANGIPMTRVLAAVGVSCTVTTFAALTAMVTGPRGVCTASVITHMSAPGAQTLAAFAGDAARAVIALTVSPATSRSDATRRPVRLGAGLAGRLASRCRGCATEDLQFRVRQVVE